MVPPANVRRHFLPWDQPLLAAAVAWLARDWSGPGPLDLSGLVVVVPTRHSGRRLREALAVHAAARGSAVLAPQVLLPEDLLAAPLAPGEPAPATRLELQLAWTQVLRGADLARYRAVFPVDPPTQGFAWAARLATQLQRLQGLLAENGLRFAEVAARPGLPEGGRWRELAELERRCDAVLARAGRASPVAAAIAAARSGAALAGAKRVVMVGTPDPLPLALEALAAAAGTVPVDVVIFAPGGRDAAGDFDGWGRPLEAAWRRREPPLRDFDAQVHLCADAADQAARVTELAWRYGEPAGLLAVGVADAEAAPVLEDGLRHAGLPVFNPEGRPRREDALNALLTALAALAREDAFEHGQALARCPDFLAWLESRDATATPAAVLQQLDELQARHLPATNSAALRHVARRPAAGAALAAVEALRGELTRGQFPENAAAVLARLFEDRKLPVGSAAADSAESWMDTLRAVARANEAFGTGDDAEGWEFALAVFGESRRFDPRPAGAVDLLGWLELLWEDAPHLVVTGLNDGRVPEAVAGDAFLPEALRVRLGLKTNEARHARDAYLLSALAASRPAGRLDLLYGKVSAAGDPLRPSRLLLACADDQLPARVARLFRAVEAARPAPAWQRAWTLRPPAGPGPTRVAVTGFRDYLWCPFRFYLKHALRVEKVDPFKAELDALDFGTLCHAALEALGRESGLRDCTDPAALREFLVPRMERLVRERYGAELPLPLLVQVESARQRLNRVADVLAAERAAGWVPERIEQKFELALGPVTVSGKIDRVERNLETGALRVLDFKTSDQAVSPAAAHVRRARRDEAAPAWARFELGERELVWADLQLPLYLEALAPEFGPAVQAGYVNLPKAVGETALTLWADYDGAWRAAARRCAEGVAAGVAAGVFWPPAEVAPRDEDDALADYFHQGAAASVTWEERR